MKEKKGKWTPGHRMERKIEGEDKREKDGKGTARHRMERKIEREDKREGWKWDSRT